METGKASCSQQELPAIWIGDLGDYNTGMLTGEWLVIDSNTTVEDINEHISRILAQGETDDSPHEEWFVAEYNNLPLSAEYPDLAEVIAVAKLVIKYGYGATKAFVGNFGEDRTEEFEERFCGLYTSVEDYAYELIQDCYDLNKMMGNLSSYFDYEAFARDLECGGDIVATYIGSGLTAIFHNW